MILGAAALQRQENCKEPNYQRTRMQKDVVIQELKKRGCRITKQRRMLLEVILENECSCCKEIYYNASRLDPGIGSATVYRMVNLLEEIGAISRRNMYKIVRNPDCKDESVCTIELDDNTVQKLSKDSFNNVVLTGLNTSTFPKAGTQRFSAVPVTAVVRVLVLIGRACSRACYSPVRH